MIGVLAPTMREDAIRQGLRELGYVEGKNILIDYRPADRTDALAGFAAELVSLNVDVIVAGGSQAVRAARQATQSIPIVMTSSSDPVGTGFVASLARPGGNVTGNSLLSPELSGKRLELLREIVTRLPTNAMIALTDAQLRQVQALLSSIYTGTLMLTEKTPQRIKCEYRTAAGGRRPDLEHFRTIQGAGTGFGLWFCVGSTARSLGGRIPARRIPSVG
jgi:ABC transporter substrate binding protein